MKRFDDFLFKFICGNLKNDKRIYIFLFLFTLITRLPGILILEIQNEPGQDGAFYYDIALNIIHGDGAVSDIKNIWFNDWQDNRGQLETRNAFPPLYVYLLSIVLRIDESLLIIRIMNAFFFSLSISLSFRLFRHNFSTEISFLSSMVLAFNPLAYIYSVSLLTEPIFILFLLLVFSLLFEKQVPTKTKYFLVGMLASLTFLIKLTGLFILASVFLWLLFQQNRKSKLLYFTIGSLALIVPYLLYNIYYTGMIFPYLSIYSETYPPLVSSAYHLRTLTSFLILVRIKTFFYDLVSLKLFGILFPFVIIGLLKNSKKRYLSIIIIYVLIIIFYHVGHHYTTRYMLPLVFLLLPLGINELFVLFKNSPSTFRNLNFAKVHIFLLVLIFFSSTLYMPLLLTEHFVRPYYDNNEDKYRWYNENYDSDIVVCSTNYMSTSYHTNSITIRLNYEHNFSTLDELVSEYNISFIIIDEFDYSSFRNNGDISQFFTIDSGNITTNNFIFNLYKVENGEKYFLKFYQVKPISEV